MRLDISMKLEHADIATSLSWSADSQLLSCGDDKMVIKWSSDGENLGKVLALNVFVTSLEWFPSLGKQAPDSFAVGCVDGTYRFFSRSGREEKKVDGHVGAVILIRWSHDGSTLLTAGEDGDLKIWSKNGNLRACLASLGQCVYCACWGHDGDQVIFGNGRMLMIKSVQSNRKALQWNAHDDIVLCVDWNTSNGLIVSGGEDCIYKVWDSFGRQLYCSRPVEHVITAVSWSPSGDHFAVGSFNLLRLCDKTGLTHCREKLSCGSLLDIAWTPDGTQFACASGNSSVVFAKVVDRRLEWKETEVILIDPRKIRVQDANTESVEDLEFSRDRVVEIGLGFEHLIVATTTQCFIYHLQNLNTPIIFDIKAPPHFIHLCSRHFLTLDPINSIQVISYEGKLLSSPKCAGLRADCLTKNMIALSIDMVTLLDSVDAKNVQIFDSGTGRVLGRLSHGCEIASVYLNQHSLGSQDRIMAFVDRNRDLFISSLGALIAVGGATSSPIITSKLMSHVESCIFHDETNVLVGLADGKLKFWNFPEVVFIDSDLLPSSTTTVDALECGRGAHILSYTGNRVSVGKQDGSVLFISSTPDIPLLYELFREGRWDESIRLCRHQKINSLWATLALMALSKKQLDTAEIALSELNEVYKVEYIQSIKQIPSEEGRHAEMAVYRRRLDEAERILLQATPSLVYRAIKMNISHFRWLRALDIAVKHKVHVDTVLAYRQKFLQSFQREEHETKFLVLSKQHNFVWEDVLSGEKREAELEIEISAKSYGRK